MKMQCERGVIRPGHKKIDAGVTQTGEVLLVVECEGTTIKVHLPAEVARTVGCGLIGGAAIGEQMGRQAKQVIAPVPSNVLDFNGRGSRQ